MRSWKGGPEPTGKGFPCRKTKLEMSNRYHRVSPVWLEDVVSPILDMYSREIISYAVSELANFEQITIMLDKAFDKLPDDTSLISLSSQISQPHILYFSRCSFPLKYCIFRKYLYLQSTTYHIGGRLVGGK